ncbi:MAG: MaoC family dehydratase [Candidatus Nanopelagicales bacterium]
MADTYTTPSFDSVNVGDAIPAQSFPVQRFNLVQYCGASGDFNIIHWNERIAQAVGLPNVIAHGLFTMAEAGRAVTDYVGDPGRVVSYEVRFTSPVVVPDDDKGALVEVSGEIVERDEATRTVTINLTATSDGAEVLGNAQARVRLA